MLSSFGKKIQISLKSGLLFFLVNLPQTYILTNRIFPFMTTIVNNCPTTLGVLLHTFIFFMLSFLSMFGSKLTTGIKIKNSLYGSLIFFFLSSPTMYTNISKIFNVKTSLKGCPNLYGIILHSLAYCIFLFFVMYLLPK